VKLRTWLRWLWAGRPRWCGGQPVTVDGTTSCGCVWRHGLMVSLCAMHERMAAASGLVLRRGRLVKICVHQEEIDEWNNPCLRCRGRKS
jgi:hypothetical protein